MSNVRTQQDLVEMHTVRERLLALLALFFAVIALVLKVLHLGNDTRRDAGERWCWLTLRREVNRTPIKAVVRTGRATESTSCSSLAPIESKGVGKGSSFCFTVPGGE